MYTVGVETITRFGQQAVNYCGWFRHVAGLDAGIERDLLQPRNPHNVSPGTANSDERDCRHEKRQRGR